MKKNKKNNENKKRKALLILAISGIFYLFIALIFFSQTKKENVFQKTSLDEYAKTVIATCSSSSYHPSCYDREIPKLIDKISMEDAFRITRIVQEKDPSFAYCHVLGHKLSEKEVQKDPSKWTQVLSRCPANGMCSNGCLHGAMQGRFKAEHLSDKQIEDLGPDLSTACEKKPNWNPTGLDQGICYHGLGHLTMYITNADFEKSIKICDNIATKSDGRNFKNVCYDGIFMQLFQPLETEDFDLVKNKTPKKEDLRSFCSEFKDKNVVESCWRQGWPLFSKEIKKAEGIVSYCSAPPNQQMQDLCFNQLFHILGQSTNFNSQDIQAVCNSLPLQRSGECFADSANSMIQADKKFIYKAVDICSLAEKTSAKEHCYNLLVEYSISNFNTGSSELHEFCESLPLKYKDKCYGKNT